ncbi:MAG: nucleoside-diphosphate kinase, partial [Gaiellaceae bacterium]
GLRITHLDLRTVSRELAERHYGEHVSKPFFAELVAFIISGPLAAMVVEGPDAVQAMRGIMGATNPIQATPGSIRGDFATEIGQNVVHGSDSADSAKHEIATFFPEA